MEGRARDWRRRVVGTLREFSERHRRWRHRTCVHAAGDGVRRRRTPAHRHRVQALYVRPPRRSRVGARRVQTYHEKGGMSHEEFMDFGRAAVTWLGICHGAARRPPGSREGVARRACGRGTGGDDSRPAKPHDVGAKDNAAHTSGMKRRPEIGIRWKCRAKNGVNARRYIRPANTTRPGPRASPRE